MINAVVLLQIVVFSPPYVATTVGSMDEVIYSAPSVHG
jgi:hypothetical protein